MKTPRASSLAPMLLLIPLVCACSTGQYRYLPAEHQSDTARRTSEAIYSEPPGNPLGTVRVIPTGMKELKNPSGGEKSQYLHLTMVISNHSKTDVWRIDPDQMTVLLPGVGTVKPARVTTPVPGSRTVAVQPGDMAMMELYYPLPPELQSENELPQFDFRWSLMAGETKVAEITPFDRVRIPENVAYYNGPYGLGYDWGMGPTWWPGYFYP